MQSSTKGLSLVGIAVVLAACADLTATSESNESSSSSGASGKAKAEERKIDARDRLTGVSSDERAKRTSSDVVADARAYATRVASRAGVTNPQFGDLGVSLTTSADGMMHVRLGQRHVLDDQADVKVWGADVVVHANATELVGLDGSVAPHIEDRFPPNAMTRNMPLAASDVLSLAKADRFGARFVPTSREDIERIVFVDADGASHLAFHSTFYNELVDGIPPGLWNHVFDAKTGELLAKWNGIDTLTQASGPGGNPKHAHAWADELDVEATESGASYVMTTTRLRTTDMQSAQSGTGTDITAALGSFTDPAVNDAHGYAEITLAMLEEWMGHDSIDDAGYRIVSRVHYGVAYENAFWNGSQMTYGDGKSTFYPLSGALDVVAHEIHHGFTTKHSNLAYSGEPGGLNESFSDIAGKTAEFFYKGSNANFDMGGDIFRSSGALRYMCEPTRDGRSIENASQMTPTLDPHYSSGVPNKAFCRLAKRLSSGRPDGVAHKEGVRRAASAFFLANASYWTSSTSFVQGCQGTVDAARALGFGDDEVSAIKTSWVDVGVYCDGLAPPPPPCDFTLTTATGELTSPSFPEPYKDNFNKTWCIEGPGETTLTFTDFETEAGYDTVTIADKTGVILSKTSGTTAPPPATSSRIYVTFKTDASVTEKGWRATWTSAAR